MTRKTRKIENMNSDLGKIVLYQSEDGQAALDVHLKDETVWLTLNQMAELLDRDKSVISRHLGNVFQTGELAREAVVAKNATTASDGKTYQVDYYNLDAIISVGYRVNAKRGTQFRIWATTILKDHLVRGYSLNQRRLAAHLLYFVIKDHPFTDGNKRIGSFLFLLFLKINDLLDQSALPLAEEQVLEGG